MARAKRDAPGLWSPSHLQRLISCVALDVLITRVDGLVTEVEFRRGRSIRLASRPGLLLGLFVELMQPAPRQPANVTTYMFRIMNAEEREILAFHFNPEGPEARPYPHLHLGPTAEVGMRALTRAHIPTGIVTLADVVRLLVEELAVKPRRADWRGVLDSEGTGR